MKLTKKIIKRGGEKYLSVYRGDELLVVLPHDDTSAEVFRTYQKIEDEREAKAAQESEDGEQGKDLESFTAEFRRRFTEEWDAITADLISRFPEQIAKIRFVSKR